MQETRHILHIDMNAFYASCHAASQPHLYANKPTAVAGNPETRHGIIVTASYEARARGVKTTMPVHQALRICPDLICITPDFELYRTFARNVFDIVRRFTPLVEVVSIDECFADVTGSGQFGLPFEIAERIQKTLRDELHLPCSIGVADTKFFAKMGSNLKKPMGITEVTRENFQQVIWPLPIGDMHGVGERTALRLERMRIHTIGQLASADNRILHNAFGVRGLELKAYANGDDDRPVVSERPKPKSIGHSVTLPQDATTMEAMHRVLLNLADQVGRRVRKQNVTGRVVTLTMRFSNMETVTRRTTLSHSTNLTEHIFRQAFFLLQSNWNGYKPIRLLGISLSDFEDDDDAVRSRQVSLFDEDDVEADLEKEQRLQKLTEVTDAIRNRYGENSIVRGRMLQSDKSNALRDHKARGTSLQKDQLFEEE